MRLGVSLTLAMLIASSALAAPPPAAPPVGGFRFGGQPAPAPTYPPRAGQTVGVGRPATFSGFQGLPLHPALPLDTVVSHYSPAYDGCMRKAVSTLDILECATRETDRWDGRLNRAYQSRMNSLNDRQRGALKRAEKTWLAFRQADCEAYQDEEWGTISRIDASQCYLRRTVERALELESFPTDHGPG